MFGETSTGAESDIQQLTEIARQMVGRWGMSEAIGPVAVLPRDGAGPLLPGAAEVSPDTQELIDDEVRRIVERGARARSSRCCGRTASKLDSLASALLEHETLDEDDAYAAAGVPRAETESADSYAAAARTRHRPLTWRSRSQSAAKTLTRHDGGREASVACRPEIRLQDATGCRGAGSPQSRTRAGLRFVSSIPATASRTHGEQAPRAIGVSHVRRRNRAGVNEGVAEGDVPGA